MLFTSLNGKTFWYYFNNIRSLTVGNVFGSLTLVAVCSHEPSVNTKAMGCACAA